MARCTLQILPHYLFYGWPLDVRVLSLRPGFDHRPVHVGFIVDKIKLEEIYNKINYIRQHYLFY